MEPFKNIFNSKSIKKIADEISKYSKDFNKMYFVKNAGKNLEDLELKDRVWQICDALNESLNLEYKKQVDIILKTLAPEQDHVDHEWEGKSQEGLSGFMIWPLTAFVERYGIDHLQVSMNALKEMTKRFTAEFAVRPYIIKYDEKVFTIFKKFKKDKSHHVRRLVSEGTRPNLPWGMKVKAVNENIERNLDLLRGLESDESLYVRRSVANHINDVSRHDKKLALKICKEWSGKSKDVDWVVRHATRSLLKQGDKEALKLHGYAPNIKLDGDFSRHKSKIKEGESLNVSVQLENKTKKNQKTLIDLEVYYLKKDGSHSPKVFRLRDTAIDSNGILSFEKKISFKKVTTRKHYSGEHLLKLKVNGKQVGETLSFHLKV